MQRMDEINQASPRQGGAKKATEGGLGYWVPGGIGNKHKLPKGEEQVRVSCCVTAVQPAVKARLRAKLSTGEEQVLVSCCVTAV